MIKKLAYLILITLFICCKTDDGKPDCSTVLCAAPTIVINLIDDTTNQNLVIQNGISIENITIKDALENQVDFTINEANSFIRANKNNTQGSIEIQINLEIKVLISYDTSAPKTDECCDFGELINVLIEGYSFELDGNTITIYL